MEIWWRECVSRTISDTRLLVTRVNVHLQELMIKWGGFEGNAQTLHLLTKTMIQNETSVRGIQPTRALLDGVLKYKKLFSEFDAPPTNHFLYDPQECGTAFRIG